MTSDSMKVDKPIKPLRLRDVLPPEFFDEFKDSLANKHLDQLVVREYLHGGWRGKHKNVMCWWRLQNGYAVGWNENPATGWSFPVIRLTQNQ